MDVKELGFELAHIGINQSDAEEGRRTADALCALFGFESRETDGSYFVNEQFEIMKKPFLGELGHREGHGLPAGEGHRLRRVHRGPGGRRQSPGHLL